MRAPRTNDTYQIDMSVATTTSSVATCLLTKATELDSILWHRKLGHISYRKMNHLVRNGLVTGVPKLRFTVADDCMPCKKGKQQRKSHKPKLQNSIDTPLELLHMDLFGPISIRSIGGKSFCLVESLCKLKVRRIRSDNGTEFKNNLMELFCLEMGIRHEFSAPYTPQQNGVAERKNRTLIETARTMLSNAKLPVTFWAEAVNTACHILNRVLVVKRHNKTCYELINNRLPNLDYLVPFGTRTVEEWFEVDCSKHDIPPEPTGPAWGFDYDALFKSFNLPDLSAVDAANVYELFGGGDHSSEDVHVDGNDAQANPNTSVGNEAPADPVNIESSSSGTQDMGELSTNLDSEIQEPNVPENTSLYSDILDTGVMKTCLHATFVSQLEPKNVKEALADNCWIEAMQDELSQFQKLHVWDLVDLPRGVQPIGTRWVFKCKTDDRHVVVKNKARLVVQGFYQLDVKSAFLYGKVHEEVYVTQPPGFEDPHNINKVYKLDKALYGLHQAPRAWYETLSKHLLSYGFDRGQIDSTLFIRKAGGDILLVQVYVDDIIFGSTNEGMCREFEQVMKSKFEMSNMGELSFFLGLQVSQREDGIYLHQTKYVQDILSKYKMNDSSTYGTHIPVNHGLHPDKDGKDVDRRLYSGMIGSLKYLTASRPDIMFDILERETRLGLRYSKQQSFDFKAYTDSDYGGCNLDRKSTSGGCQFLGDRLVSWQCKKQSTVSVSTCEAKYIVAASGCSQILWIQQQLRDYGLNFTGTPLFTDNNATMSITNNPVKHSKTKHIEIRHHFIRDCAEKHLIELVKVYTDDNIADLFTKAFDRSRFEHLVNLIGMFNPK
ncbi:hypothetical protein L1987_53464 [Smallanthus sonchifolius]|uniref:Uncharacterized protein n=1 Tax=Smallanthus sonchifolius TaxID=185202 RepID=A0ACB9EX76_9ASTR|nr:hypothetical protein L1987_53464 [Smallanthus sonchifolius]